MVIGSFGSPPATGPGPEGLEHSEMLKPVLVFGCLDQGEAHGTGGAAPRRSGAIAEGPNSASTAGLLSIEPIPLK